MIPRTAALAFGLCLAPTAGAAGQWMTPPFPTIAAPQWHHTPSSTNQMHSLQGFYRSSCSAYARVLRIIALGTGGAITAWLLASVVGADTTRPMLIGLALGAGSRVLANWLTCDVIRPAMTPDT